MEWDFTKSEVLKGKVDYSLENFYRDLKEDVDSAFTEYTALQKEELNKMWYAMMHFAALGNSYKEISKLLSMKINLVEDMLDDSQEDIRMLEAVFMGKYLSNLKEFNGLIGDSTNLELVNAYFKDFYINKITK
ncbi:hypothetical protein HON22_03925 [Candidatus Peregrinibacteria bacterium]|jgi:hypothetical protein|nr:hypothetical protein [Candidatus Peregrinibacteria bacterium]